MVLRNNWAPIAAVAATLALALPATALAVDGTASITGAPTTAVSGVQAPTLTATLNGTDQSVTDPFDMTVEDSRGTGAGWSVSITSTTFSTGGATPKTLPANAAAITGVTATCVEGATCTDPTASGLTYPLTVPAAGVAPAAVTMYSAPASSGMGKFTITPTMRLAVPANAYASTYTSTMTITSAETP